MPASLGTFEIISGLLEGHTDRGEEGDILELLSGLEAEELDDVVARLDMSAVFDAVDNRMFGPDNQSELVRLLAYARRDDLGLHALASLVRGMQDGKTTEEMETAIRDILVSKSGDELTHLKNIINLAHGRHDLEGLIYRDIDDEGIRREILDHFAANRDVPVREAKVLSDIDDTALAKIHEERYPKGTVIPGILAFYDALDNGPDDKPTSRGDLTFVTARPSDAFGLIKGHSRDALTTAGFSDLSIMTGSVFNVATHDGMAAKKVANISHYAQLFPEYDLVFVGDSGQGDITVGEAIRESHPEVVKGVFIHDVVALPDERRQELAGKGIWVVDTYVGAAIKACEANLVSAAGVQNVIAETRRLLDEIVWDSTKQEREMRDLVERDAARA